MQSDDEGGADSPTLSVDEGGNMTSDQNRHMATSTRWAKQGSATISAPPSSASTGGVVVAVAVAVAARRISKAVGGGDGCSRPIQI